MNIKTKTILSLLMVLIIHVSTAQGIYDLILKYDEDKYALYRKYPVKESSDFYNRMTRFYEECNKELKTIAFNELTKVEKADYILFKNQIDRDSYFLKIDQKEYDEVANVTIFAGSLYKFVSERG